MPKIKEREFRVRWVQPFLKKLKNTVIFPIQQASIRGTPDYLLCIKGRFAALELKKSKGKTTRLQETNLLLVSLSGGVSLVASPDNWEEIKEVLTKLDGSNTND